jgi:hypothetical protein
MAASRVCIQTQDFDVSHEVAQLQGGDKRVGAVCSFVGLVRDRNGGTEGSVDSMELEHYPGMTEKSIEAMIDEAHRAGGGDIRTPRREFQGLRVLDGLSEDPGTVLEEGSHTRRCALGGCARER